jgi:hypothetical protein
MAKKHLDKLLPVVSKKPDVEAIKQARRWLRGAAMLLADASNGVPTIERLAREAIALSAVAEILEHDYARNS